MRVRMTLVFVLILAPFLVMTSHLVVITHRSRQADEDKRNVKLVIEKASTVLNFSDWEREMGMMFSSSKLRQAGIGALVADESGQVLWRSDENAPSWPNPAKDHSISIQRGKLRLVVGVPHELLSDDSRLHSLITLSFAAVAAFAVAAWLLIGRTLSPIRALAHQAEVAEETGTRLTPPSQDAEMCELVTTLNGLLDRVERASEEKASFYAAASHELRTPLQALLGHLEVTLAQPRTEKEYQATLQEAHAQTHRLVSLVEGILLLHQLQGRKAANQEPVCLSAIVEETLETFGPLIEARGLQLEEKIQSDIVASSAPEHARIMVRNLLENAAKYGHEGGSLKVVLDRTGLRVENEAPGISVERLLEPFYRLDASRSSKSGGNGLGLAICRALAKANGWKLTLTQQESRIVAQVDFGPGG